MQSFRHRPNASPPTQGAFRDAEAGAEATPPDAGWHIVGGSRCAPFQIQSLHCEPLNDAGSPSNMQRLRTRADEKGKAAGSGRPEGRRRSRWGLALLVWPYLLGAPWLQESTLLAGWRGQSLALIGAQSPALISSGKHVTYNRRHAAGCGVVCSH